MIQDEFPTYALSIHMPYKIPKLKISSHFAKRYFFFAWHLFMHMLNISVLYMQSIRKLQWKLWYKLTSPCMHYLSKSKTRKQEKMAKFTKLSFSQKLIFWHKTFSCKCPMCLYYARKVSDSFSQNSGTSWFPPACNIWALTKPLLRSKVLKNG